MIANDRTHHKRPKCRKQLAKVSGSSTKFDNITVLNSSLSFSVKCEKVKL